MGGWNPIAGGKKKREIIVLFHFYKRRKMTARIVSVLSSEVAGAFTVRKLFIFSTCGELTNGSFSQESGIHSHPSQRVQTLFPSMQSSFASVTTCTKFRHICSQTITRFIHIRHGRGRVHLHLSRPIQGLYTTTST